MQFFRNESHDPAFNLALEELLVSEYPEELFMLWRNGPAIIVGCNQNTAAEIDGAYVKEQKIRVVRRITGGGAVYHDLGNVNFTLAVNDRHLGQAEFAEYAAPVVAMLRAWGVPAEFSGRNDILAEGRKVSGSARSVLKDRTLFHGTLLFDTDLTVLSRALRPDPEKIRSKGIRSVRSRVVNLKEFLPGMTREEFPEKLTTGLLKQLGLGKVSPLPGELLRKAEVLAECKYRTWEWNWGTRIPYHFSRRARLAAGTLQVELNVRENRIAELQFSGDFFGTRPVSGLAEALIGTEFRADAVLARLREQSVPEYVSGATAEEVASLFE